MSAAVALATAAVADARTLKARLRDEDLVLPVRQVERELGAVNADLDSAVTALRTEYGVEGHDAVAALLELATTLTELARQRNAGRARIVEWPAPFTGNAAMLAFELYGDVDRRHELVDLNAIANPNRIPVGTLLEVLER